MLYCHVFTNAHLTTWQPETKKTFYNKIKQTRINRDETGNTMK